MCSGAEEAAQGSLSHLDSRGRARMVDVSGKAVTVRRAEAGAVVVVGEHTWRLLRANSLSKGDALSVAQTAGVLAAKRTWELVPLCHPLALTHVQVQLELRERHRGRAWCVEVRSEVKCQGQTGVEMEALTAAAVAALTLYDMCKSASKDMVISDLRLLSKSGGRSGEYRREDGEDS